MDFFDDPNIFGGELDSLVQDDPGFTPGAVSLDDELHLGPSLENLQVDAGPRSSTIQHGIAYSQPVGHFDTVKAQTSIEQSFPGPDVGSNDGRAFLSQQQPFQRHTMNQVPQTNGLFLHNSPMWGNHDHKGNNYHQHHQHHQQLHQQLQHKHFQQQQQFQQHQAQHQQYSHQHLQQRQHSLNQHPISNQLQLPHQQIAHQGLHHIGKTYQEHLNFYYEGSVPQNHSQQHHHNSLSVEGSPFHPTVAPSGHSQSKQYLEASMRPVSSQQSGFQVAQGVQGFTTGPRLEDNDLAFPVQPSPATHSFPTDSVSHASSYPTARYAPPVVNETQSYSSAPVSITTSSMAISPSASNLLDTGCPFLSNSGMEHQQQQVRIPGSPAQQCPLRSSKSDQNPFNSSEVFSDGLNSFSSDRPFSTAERRTCDVPGPLVANQSVSSINGFQALEEVLLGEQHDQRLDDLSEGPDLIGDELLPQLEALDQEENSNHSWINVGLGNGRDEEVKEQESMEDVPMVYDAQVREAVLRSFPNVSCFV